MAAGRWVDTGVPVFSKSGRARSSRRWKGRFLRHSFSWVSSWNILRRHRRPRSPGLALLLTGIARSQNDELREPSSVGVRYGAFDVLAGLCAMPCRSMQQDGNPRILGLDVLREIALEPGCLLHVMAEFQTVIRPEERVHRRDALRACMSRRASALREFT